MATKHVATWVWNTSFSDLPDNVIQAAVRSFYNWAGCAVGGSQHPATTIAYNALSPLFGPPSASILGHQGNLRADPQHAALLNGIASHVLDYDDTHLDTIIHPTGPVASAALAAAEWKGGVSGEESILALVVGIEVECKLGLAVFPEHYNVGWHITSTTGSIGAAAAVSKILKLTLEQTVHALGTAATQVAGLREMFGSHTKPFHVGRAAQNGLLAALLAQGGYTSSEQAVEGKRGWANVVGVTKSDLSESLDKWLGMGEAVKQGMGLVDKSGLGRWEVLRNSFKPYPCGIVIHPMIDGCVQLHHDLRRSSLETRDIKSVSAQVHPLVLELTGKRKPKDGLEGKFSVFHGGAVGLIYGKASPNEYEDSVVQDATVISVRDRIDVHTSTAIRPDEAKITLTMSSGQGLEKHVEHALGSVEVPMEEEMLEDKFKQQCVSVADADTASTLCWSIARADDVAKVARAL